MKGLNAAQEENQAFNGYGNVLVILSTSHLLAAKTNYGVYNGKYYFEIKVLEKIQSDNFQGLFSEEKNTCKTFIISHNSSIKVTRMVLKDKKFAQEHACRVGWSTTLANSDLGN